MNSHGIFSPFKLLPAVLFTALVLIFSACQGDDDDGNPNEEELITSVVLIFTKTDGTSTSFSFKDTDGSGGANPVVQNISLTAATNYNLSIKFLDESDPSDVEDITLEVAEENTEHLVCFDTQGSMPQPVIEDADTNGKPLGLVSRITTTSAGTGQLTIGLRHQPDKNAATPCNTGDTDVEATFGVTVN